jgi:hypothetical protein
LEQDRDSGGPGRCGYQSHGSSFREVIDNLHPARGARLSIDTQGVEWPHLPIAAAASDDYAQAPPEMSLRSPFDGYRTAT